MPAIPTYQQPNLSLTPSELGPESFAQAGRRVNALLDQAGDAVSRAGSQIGTGIRTLGDAVQAYDANREIAAGATHGAPLVSGLEQDWNDVSQHADVNDPSVVQKWLQEKFEPTVQDFQDGFTTEKGQQWAQSYIEKMRNHFYEKTSADMAMHAGIAQHVAAKQMANEFSNSAIRDPSSVPFLLDSVDHMIGGLVDSSPYLKGVDAVKLKTDMAQDIKEQIVKSGAFGVVQHAANPDTAADAWVSKYPQYINGAEAKVLAQNAREQIRARNSDDEQNRRRAKEVAQDNSNEATNQYLIDVRSKDPKLTNDPTAQKILNDPNLLKADKNNLLNLIDRQLKPETDARTSHDTFVGLLRQLRDPDADTDQVMQKAWDSRLTDPGKSGSLSENDFNQFRNEVIARKTPEGEALARDRDLFFKRYQQSIDPTGGIGVGKDKTYQPLYAAEMAARQQEAALQKKGIDPHELYRPGSQYFFGQPDNIIKFRQPPLATQVQQQQQPDLTAPPPDRPANYPKNAQWDPNARYWFLVQDGKKFRIDPSTAR